MIALIGERYREKLGKPLENQGFSVAFMKDNPNVDPRLAGHVDLSVFLYGKTAVLAGSVMKQQEIVNILTNSAFSVKQAQSTQSADYPNDANLCARVIGEKVIHNQRHSDQAIRELGCAYIDVRQAYSACSVCTVSCCAIITSDRGIATAAGINGIDVLLIAPGAIRLEGFNYGFIGGSSFVDGDTVYFSGKLDAHPDFDRITAFIEKYGKACVFLTDEPAFDFGGAVLL